MRWETFSILLSQRIQDYFSSSKIPRTADSVIFVKISFGLCSFTVTYAALVLASLPPLAFLGAYLLHGMAHLFLLLNVGHDANHNALSRSPHVNRALSYTMDLCGINSRVWRILHHRFHHYSINIHERDEAIGGRGLLRFSPDAPRRGFHRYQHLYALPAYCLVSLDWIFIKDFNYFFRSNVSGLAIARPSLREYVILFLSKGFYIGYMIGAPIFFFNNSAWLVVSAFVIAHALIGFFALLVFQTTHVLDDNDFPVTCEAFESYVQHVFATTVDCAPNSRLLNWWSGGLNTHIIHHLYPAICHTHYRVLSRILRRTAEECGMLYRENPTARIALAQHLKLLRRLGNDDANSGRLSSSV
jgi:linoleoyl-CoA desaturase